MITLNLKNNIQGYKITLKIGIALVDFTEKKCFFYKASKNNRFSQLEKQTVLP